MTGSIGIKKKVPFRHKIKPEIEAFIEETMNKDDETTLQQLCDKIHETFGIKVSRSTVDRYRRKNEWTFKSAAYCQIVREANRVKRLKFAEENPNFPFDDEVIFTDETSCELQCHRLRCARKKGQPPKRKPRPKHPVKVGFKLLLRLFCLLSFSLYLCSDCQAMIG